MRSNSVTFGIIDKAQLILTEWSHLMIKPWSELKPTANLNVYLWSSLVSCLLGGFLFHISPSLVPALSSTMRSPVGRILSLCSRFSSFYPSPVERKRDV